MLRGFGTFWKVSSRVCFVRMASATAAAGGRKPGVAGVEELRNFVDQPGLIVVDVRNSDPSIEEEGTVSIGPLAETDGCGRPSALNVVWDRAGKSMPMTKLLAQGKDVPIVTH